MARFTKVENETKEQARAAMVATVDRIDAERNRLKEKEAELRRKLKPTENNKNPASFAMADVLPTGDFMAAEQIWEQINSIQNALKSPNTIDSEFRAHSVIFVDCIAKEAAEMLDTHNRAIADTEMQIKKLKRDIEKLKQAKKDAMSAFGMELDAAGMGTLGLKFHRYETPTAYAREYKQLCEKLDNGEFVSFKAWQDLYR